MFKYLIKTYKSSWYESAVSASMIREIPKNSSMSTAVCKMEIFAFDLSGTLDTFIYGIKRSINEQNGKNSGNREKINHFDTLETDSFESSGVFKDVYVNQKTKVNRLEHLYCAKCRETQNFKKQFRNLICNLFKRFYLNIIY